MNKADNSVDLTDRISFLRKEISDILEILIQIELNRPFDNRSYSSLDLIEACTLTQEVILNRLNVDDFNEWKNDNKQEYIALIKSIKSQVIETIQLNFQNKDGKYLAFVNSYNVLVVDRLFDIIHILGPSGTASLILPIMADMIKTIEMADNPKQGKLHAMQQQLNSYRKSYTPPLLSRSTREHIIRNICENLQQIPT